MKALTWHGTHDVRVDNVPDPTIQEPRDAIIKVTATAICGSDLHLYNGLMAGMQPGDVLGHEFMGEVVETGSAITNLKKGDRVVASSGALDPPWVGESSGPCSLAEAKGTYHTQKYIHDIPT